MTERAGIFQHDRTTANGIVLGGLDDMNLDDRKLIARRRERRTKEKGHNGLNRCALRRKIRGRIKAPYIARLNARRQ
jgi:hypothetical protein